MNGEESGEEAVSPTARLPLVTNVAKPTRKQNLPADQWIERFGDWLNMQSLLKK